MAKRGPKPRPIPTAEHAIVTLEHKRAIAARNSQAYRKRKAAKLKAKPHIPSRMMRQVIESEITPEMLEAGLKSLILTRPPEITVRLIFSVMRSIQIVASDD